MYGLSGVHAASHVEGGSRHGSGLVRGLAMVSARKASLKLKQRTVMCGSVSRESGGSGVIVKKAGISEKDVTKITSVSTRRGSVGGRHT